MLLGNTLDYKGRKSIVILLGVVLIATVWYAEKTKYIPQYGVLFYEMGVRCEGRCRRDQQLQYFQKAVKYNDNIKLTHHNSGLSDAHYRSALIYEEMGNDARAIESFKQAINFDQENTLAYYQAGLHYFKKNDYENAFRFFLQSIKRINYPDELHYYIARIYDQKKQYVMAIPHYYSVLLARPEFFNRVYPRLAAIYHADEETVRYSIHKYRGIGSDDMAEKLEWIFKEALAFESLGTK